MNSISEVPNGRYGSHCCRRRRRRVIEIQVIRQSRGSSHGYRLEPSPDYDEGAIDACERIEAIDSSLLDKNDTVDVNGQKVSARDFLTSAWTYPENIRYQIIHARHEAGEDLHYVPEAARILVAMAQASAELIGTDASKPANESIRRMICWFDEHLPEGLKAAIAGQDDQ